MNRNTALLPSLLACLVVFMSLTGKHIPGISHMLICERDKLPVLLEWKQNKQVAGNPALIFFWCETARMRLGLLLAQSKPLLFELEVHQFVSYGRQGFFVFMLQGT